MGRNTVAATKAPTFPNFYTVDLKVVTAWEAQGKPLRQYLVDPWPGAVMTESRQADRTGAGR
jgi:hypothetical protein